MKVIIKNYGCDGATKLETEITEVMFNVLDNVFDELNETSDHQCDPIISIEKVTEE